LSLESEVLSRSHFFLFDPGLKTLDSGFPTKITIRNLKSQPNMLISNFDLYKSDWLELVFDNRNKAYGAYDLRQRYAGNMIMAMSITFLSVGALCATAFIFKPHQTAPAVQIISDPAIVPVIITPIKQIITPPKKMPELPKPVDPPKITAFTPPVVVPDPLATTLPPEVTKISGTSGQTTTDGKGTPLNVLPGVATVSGTGDSPMDDKKIYSTIGLQSMPEPIGGDKAWSKFLSRNLRFPPDAQEASISGRVIVGFIIEKDGTLTNITVDKPAGSGFDEEALRVLKLAKAWKPGIQNGQPVRVKFEIPINFQFTGDNN
jgi:protein TonB